MRRALLGLLAACSTTSKPADPCATSVVGQVGTLQIGTDSSMFAPISDGQSVTVHGGLDGLWLFVLTARVSGLDVDSAEGGVSGHATDGNGQLAALNDGCRNREFSNVGSGYHQLVYDWGIAIDPNYTLADGTTMTLSMSVQDRDGHEATDARTIVVRLPPPPP